MCCTQLAENTGHKARAKNRHLRTIAQLRRAIYTTKARVDNRKKLVKQQYLLQMCSQYGENFGPLAAKVCWRVWGTPANINGFCILATLLHSL